MPVYFAHIYFSSTDRVGFTNIPCVFRDDKSFDDRCQINDYLLLMELKRQRSLITVLPWLITAACHAGGKNSVIPEKTLEKAALQQYLAGGFKIESIVTQVHCAQVSP